MGGEIRSKKKNFGRLQSLIGGSIVHKFSARGGVARGGSIPIPPPGEVCREFIMDCYCCYCLICFLLLIFKLLFCCCCCCCTY